MCHIISRLSTVVCGKIVISMFRYFFHAIFFTFFTPVYKCFAFSSIFQFQNCIQVFPSIKSILKITVFCVVEKPLFLCVFIPNGFPYIFVHRKESMKFSHKILNFLLFCISLYYICHIYSTLTLDENRKCSVGGGYGFFSKKIFWFPMLLKKIFWFWWRKKKII
jgi:hypothetical protein